MPTRLPSIKFKFCLGTRCLHTSSLNFNQSSEVQIENMYKREMKERIVMISETNHSDIKMWQPKWSNIPSDKNKLRIHWYIIFFMFFFGVFFYLLSFSIPSLHNMCVFLYMIKFLYFWCLRLILLHLNGSLGSCKGEELDWRQSDKLNNSSPSVTLVSNQTTEQRIRNNKQSNKQSNT